MGMDMGVNSIFKGGLRFCFRCYTHAEEKWAQRMTLAELVDCGLVTSFCDSVMFVSAGGC